jgi:hypothetical protein
MSKVKTETVRAELVEVRTRSIAMLTLRQAQDERNRT